MNTMPEDRKVILITGTSKGIGLYLAQHYISKGFQVIGCSRNSVDFSDSLYTHICADISEEQDILEIYKFIRKDIKRLDVLINNAAINPAIVSAALLPYETISQTFRTNVFAPMLFCREAVKLMTRNKFGRIINMGSMASKHEVPGEALYTSTKTALNAYSRVLAKEVAKAGITVNVIAPSAIRTELSGKINPMALQEVLSRNAIAEYGEMNDVSNIIDVLIKEESSAITGQIIYLGGV
jgi:3-oxoacyl-[acyl-carrier protein] reductase